MKRLLPYFILALAFHAIILSIDFGWLKLAPSPIPASKSLSITLTADKIQKHKAQNAVFSKVPEKQVEPIFNQKPRQNLTAMPAPALVEQTGQLQKPRSASPPKKNVKKVRQKKSLKALTRKKQTIKTSEVARTVSIDKRHVPLKVRAKIHSPSGSGNQPVSQALPADTGFISTWGGILAASA